jgi:hypothetical protein
LEAAGGSADSLRIGLEKIKEYMDMYDGSSTESWIEESS